MTKSFKLSFIKNERKDTDPDLRIPMYSTARKTIAECKFIQCGKLGESHVINPNTCTDYNKIENNTAFVFDIDMPEDGPLAESSYMVSFTKVEGKVISYIYGSVYTVNPKWTLIMRVEGGSEPMNFIDPLNIKPINERYPAESYVNRANLAKRVMRYALSLVGSQYRVVDDLTKTLALRNIGFNVRPTYNNFEIIFNTASALINTIEYTYEGSEVNLEESMLTELPFRNFNFKILFKDPDIESVSALFDEGKLHLLMPVYGKNTGVSVGYVDLNESKYGSPINVNTNMIYGYQNTEAYDEETLAIALNVVAKAFLEFMFKFNRLVPYSDNVSGTTYVEHVCKVVNNTSVHKIVILGGDKKRLSTQGHKGGRHASPREHSRIGHTRTYKSGKVIWIDETTINEGCVGKVTKTYKFAN